ncbi:uncharacterized protein UV8b_05326 [Ustilaginoidea virens]|uniref:2EXR domain-containing protein n=1 Tax=Ustilaginoidea virens TaxID=1159556 RepID=A0A063C7Y8_USTVR|nr:uncharacterized protein UV8b_05326 [Ustilaginoidea virens]QUC21083.1 hypothetical protein UV8b_05326 [Ustilaginoidea virens]GAO14612.1 hypothetical protein UVI_02009360 [Ustilaginoidea virens]
MFPLFLQLPSDIRRKIWLATLGPMTLTFTEGEPPVEVDEESELAEEDPHETERRLSLSELYSAIYSPSGQYFDSTDTPEDTDEVADDDAGDDDVVCPQKKLFANYTRYFGYVALKDGSSRLTFVVESSAAYLACKESRAFLRFIFAEPVRPGGGLPSWFRFDMDTVRFKDVYLDMISEHAWFTQTENLIVAIVCGADNYLGLSDDILTGKKHSWIQDNLACLKNITFEMHPARSARTCGPKALTGDWLDPWWEAFEQWYNCKYGSEPASFYAKVISYCDGIPEVTPENYLRAYKIVQQKHYQTCFPNENWKSNVWSKRTLDILEATDEELNNPTEFLKKHRPSWDE